MTPAGKWRPNTETVITKTFHRTKRECAKLKQTIKACKENFWHKTCEKISSPKVLFKIIQIIKNRTNPNYSSFNIIENDGTLLTNEQSQANCFLQYYTKQNNDNIPNISIPDNRQDINKSFSLKELEIAISHQKNSSPGHDKISLQSINHLPIKAINLLLKSFNDSWSSSQIPKDWTRAIILPFIKPHKNPKEVSSYRPISLTSVIDKLLERMILHRIGTNWNKTIGEMQESLNKISVRCKKWKLSTSPEKSSLINFSRKRSTIPPLLKICDKPIPKVKSLKILGIIFDPNITWKNHINYLSQKGFKYLNVIKALSSPKIGTRSVHLLNIISATIRSIFDYGSQLFSFSSNSNRQKLEPIYNAVLRLALGLPRNTPLDLLRAESRNGREGEASSGDGDIARFHLNFEGEHPRGGQGPGIYLPLPPTSREDLWLDGYLEYHMPWRHYALTNIQAFSGIQTQALRHCSQHR
ncbi:putative RNA-directed DNA polymerase from transposon BS [Trichonephila clavipes]|nr:putative RNA-directed DNA polymerase from transposon BS [Trichonephila clavipes]